MLEALARDAVCNTGDGARPIRASVADAGEQLSFAGTRLFKEGFLDQMGVEYGQRSGRSITILGGGCDDGLSAVRRGQAMLGGLCCPVEGSPAEGLDHVTVALDMKVIVVNPRVDVESLTWRQLVGVLSGSLHNWKTVGGRDQPIAVVLHDHCPSYVEPTRRLLLGERATWSRQALYVKTDQKHLDTVARFDSAIGVNSWILAEPYVRDGRLAVLAIDGVAPTLQNAAKGRYRLIGPMNMIYAQWTRSMDPFFDFLFSPVGRGIIAQRTVPVQRHSAKARPVRA